MRKKVITMLMVSALVFPVCLSAQTSRGETNRLSGILEASFGLGEYTGVQGIIGHNVDEKLFLGVGMSYYERCLFVKDAAETYSSAAFTHARYAFTSGKLAPYAGADLGFGLREGKLFTGLEAGARLKAKGPSHLWLSLSWDREAMSVSSGYHEMWALKLGYSF